MQTEHSFTHCAITMTEKGEHLTQFENTIKTLSDTVNQYRQQAQDPQGQLDEANKQLSDSERIWGFGLKVMSDLVSALHSRISEDKANISPKEKNRTSVDSSPFWGVCWRRCINSLVRIFGRACVRLQWLFDLVCFAGG
eukprot:TRINITY_DN45800_c0_g1_i1.p2 TRINITY_DN45800_c0_g1~~TRINITY_DN45800_c0_g1_i1.p2  ORF type:complete len:139 (-),score=12.07 TRINITY_DN45800_c0_g1_i1:143-559(-)